MRTLLRNARILTLDDDDTEYMTSSIVIENGKIAALGPGAEPGQAGAFDRIVDAEGCLAMPGLINGHFHSPSAFMKGALEGMPLELAMLYDVPWDGLAHSPRVYYLRAALSAIEMLKTGVTSVRDDAFFFGNPTGETIDALFQAYLDCGMRASIGFGINNVVEYEKLPYLKSFLSPAHLETMERSERLSTRDVIDLYRHAFERWHNREDGRLMVHASCSAPQRVELGLLQALSKLAVEHDVSYDLHVLETKAQRVLGQEKIGQSLVEYMHSAGVLTEHAIVIHAVWATERDLALIRRAGAVVAHNPVSNLRFGSGVMPYLQIREAGIPMCLGTDEVTNDEANNLWITAKIGNLLQKIATPEFEKWPSSGDYLDMMCGGGARALRRAATVGMLKRGYDADIILIDLNRCPFVPLNDLRTQLVHGETGSSVVLTMVRGEIVCERGRVLGVDEDAIKREIRELWPRYREECDRSNAQARELASAYRRTYERAAGEDVGFSRWLS